MNVAQRAVRESRTAENALVIIPQESGYRVYAASDPSRMYEVSEEEGRWRCTCPDFDYHNHEDPDWRCEHILAVVPWSASADTHTHRNGNGHAVPPVSALSADNLGQPPAALMLIRRSVSPDGRIDSVSVEFTLSVGGDSSGAIKDKALRTLGLQREIVTHFLGGGAANGNGHAEPAGYLNGNGARKSGNGHANGHHANGNGTIPARIIEIGEVQGKWGPRLCLTFQVNGNRARIFGSAKQLAARLGEAGFDYDPAVLRPGRNLNLDCLVTTQPSDDGRFLNVEHLYPLHPNGGGR